jgi:hypothetical protein
MTTPKVYEAICAVMEDIGHSGISKGRKNQQQGYNFRGIDDVYNELNSLLSKHKVIMTPRILAREVTERQTQKGGVLFYVTVEAEFDFISAEDGSKHTVRTFGEAMDSADKATNKAMSAAYKYAAMMVFCIPTEGDNDADAVTHEVAPKAMAKPTSSAEQKRGLEAIEADLLDCHSVMDVNKCAKIWASIMDRDGWSKDFREVAIPKFGKRRDALAETPVEDIFPGDRPTGAVANMMAG